MIRRVPITYDNALNRAAALCAKCEQCTPDILKKLNTWGLNNADSRRIIGRLMELNFVDDERFARAYAHDKLAFSGWGRLKIARGLWAKRIPRALIERALADIDDEEYSDVAMRVMRSKTRLCPDLLEDYDGRMKLMRFGAGRGFEPSLISSIITELRAEAASENDE